MRSLAYYEVTFQGKTYNYKKQKDIADAFGVSLTMINNIYNNKYPSQSDMKIEKKYYTPKTIEKVEN